MTLIEARPPTNDAAPTYPEIFGGAVFIMVVANFVSLIPAEGA